MSTNENSIMREVSLSEEEEIEEEEIMTNMEDQNDVKENTVEVTSDSNDLQALEESNGMPESPVVPKLKNYTELEDKVEALEKERGELTAEVMAKDSLIGKLEKESSSLKAEIAQLETNHANVAAEHERKFLQLSEEMAAKVAEVCNYSKYYLLLFLAIIYSIYS